MKAGMSSELILSAHVDRYLALTDPLGVRGAARGSTSPSSVGAR